MFHTKINNELAPDIQDAYQGDFSSFNTLEKVSVVRKIRNINRKEAVNDDDIPVNVLKENALFFREMHLHFYSNTIASSRSPYFLKMANVTPV